MKKINLLFSLIIAICAVVNGNAQTILTHANMSPAPGDIFYGHYLDTNVAKGPSGPNVTWDFSMVTETSRDTTWVYACDSTPYCGVFSGSNIAELNVGNYIYFISDTASLSVIGVNASGVEVFFSEPWKQLQYPFVYNTVHVDTSMSSVASSGEYHIEVDSFIYDGYGSIHLPGGTDTGAVRIHTISYITDSSATMPNMYSRTETYDWYVPGFHNPVFSIYYANPVAASGPLYVNKAVYFVKGFHSAGVNNVNLPVSPFSVYPNPATDLIHISFETHSAGEATIDITDVLGRNVATPDHYKVIEGKNDISYNASSIAPGLYFIRMVCDGQTMTKELNILK